MPVTHLVLPKSNLTYLIQAIGQTVIYICEAALVMLKNVFGRRLVGSIEFAVPRLRASRSRLRLSKVLSEGAWRLAGAEGIELLMHIGFRPIFVSPMITRDTANDP